MSAVKWLCCLLVLTGALIVPLAVAYSEGPSDPAKHLIQFPEIKGRDKKTADEVVDTVTSDRLYVIKSSAKLILLDSPGGLVDIKEKTGPTSLGGIFADGNGELEFRDYPTGTFLYVVLPRPKSSGKIELLALSELRADKVKRQTVTVIGKGNPTPDVDPEILTPFQKEILAAYAKEKDSDKALVPGLAKVYGDMVAKGISTYPSWTDLFNNKIDRQEKAGVKEANLPNIKMTIGFELSKSLPTMVEKNAPITASDAVKIETVFKSVQEALQKVK